MYKNHAATSREHQMIIPCLQAFYLQIECVERKAKFLCFYLLRWVHNNYNDVFILLYIHHIQWLYPSRVDRVESKQPPSDRDTLMK